MRCSSSLPTYDSVETRDRIFGQGYIFLSFAKNMGKYICLNLRSTYTRKLLDDAKRFATDAFKTASKK